MSDAVAAAIIGGQALVLAAVLPLLISTRRHAKTAAEETSNDHKTNFRVESDERHAETAAKLDNLTRLMHAQGRRIGRVDRRVTTINTRLAIVEDTIPRRSTK
ncbi:hypothetical protein [Parafrigoribacterium humi]|uniref:hypothetical protein n=1 Tax=Parafrigoribacterium humi TaxID=3144664 RepID=UPI0032EB26BE